MQTFNSVVGRNCLSVARGALLVVLFGITCRTQAQTQSPTLTVSGTTISADGLTPGGPVLFFAIQQVRIPHGTAFRRIERIVTGTSQSGHAQLANTPVATAAVWAAIDLTTGRSTAATPDSLDMRAIPSNNRALKSTPEGILNRLAVGRSMVEGVLVRPGGGAWAFTVGDGTANDADGEVNGHVECRIDQMRPLGASGAPPASFLPSDTLIVIDPARMATTVIEVPQ